MLRKPQWLLQLSSKSMLFVRENYIQVRFDGLSAAYAVRNIPFPFGKLMLFYSHIYIQYRSSILFPYCITVISFPYLFSALLFPNHVSILLFPNQLIVFFHLSALFSPYYIIVISFRYITSTCGYCPKYVFCGQISVFRSSRLLSQICSLLLLLQLLFLNVRTLFNPLTPTLIVYSRSNGIARSSN